MTEIRGSRGSNSGRRYRWTGDRFPTHSAYRTEAAACWRTSAATPVTGAGPGPTAARPNSRGRVSEGEAQGRAGFQSYLLYLGVAFLLAVVLSWSGAAATRLGFRINELKSQIASLRAENEKLAYQLSGYESLARVEREAERLGMIRPDYVRAAVRGASAETAASLSGSGGSGLPTVDLSSGGGEVTGLARIIPLAPNGVGPIGGDALAADGGGRSGSGGLVSLWDRFYRWLTGISLAEARDWQ